MKIFVCFLMVCSFLLAGCSNQNKSSAKLKVNLGNLLNMPTGIGDGGAILYGQSSTGEIFGKAITSNELDLTLNNGQWKFWAFFWDNSNPTTPMNGKVYCGKTTANLNGGDASLAISVTNAACDDREISTSATYSTTPTTASPTASIRFADFFMEDCDNLSLHNGKSCGLLNQGGALSYQLVYSDFQAGPNAPVNFSGATFTTACVSTSTVSPSANSILNPFPINFPMGNGLTPFIIKARFFLGNYTCDQTDPKGFHEVVFGNGLGYPNPGNGSKVTASTQACAISQVNSAYYTSGATPADNQFRCLDDYASWTSGICSTSAIPSSYLRFFDSNNCKAGGFVTSAPTIKQAIQIPKGVICDKYLNSSTTIGSNPFAAGDGTTYRPYKICNEWQLNQIGENNSLTSYQSSHYTLMNDLDMNRTDMGPYAKINCVNTTVTGTDTFNIGNHNNFNPLDKTTNGSCTTEQMSPNFNGIFNGNGHQISNLRNSIDGIPNNGFVRNLSANGMILNLNLKNVEVSGKLNVGAIAGSASPANNLIKNIFIVTAKVDAVQASNQTTTGQYVGAIAGTAGPTTFTQIMVYDAKIRGSDYVGGLVGNLSSNLSFAGFNGTITNYNSSSLYTGGLAGNASSGGSTISNAFTEGKIISSSTNIGGIAGASQENLADVYSTMYILSGAQSGNAYVGGLVGNHTGGTIIDGVFDGSLATSGMATYSINGDVGFQSSGACTNVYTLNSYAASTCGTSLTTYAQLRALTSASFSNPLWQFQTNELPRLIFENRECISNALNVDTVINQATAGRGTATNPIVICNSFQLSGLNNRPSTEYYRMAQDIDISSITTFNSMISQFNGNFNGDDNVFYGMNAVDLNDPSIHSYGLFRNNAGNILNLKFYGNQVYALDTLETGTGIVAGINSGTLFNIELIGNRVTGANNDGIAVGQNTSTGTINQSYVDYSWILGQQSFGGIVGLNNGVVSRASINVNVSNNTMPTITNMGGAIGVNTNFVEQIKFSGSVNNTLVTSSNALNAGGIIGDNEGTLLNSYTDNNSMLQVMSASNVGGLVGLAGASSNITNSFSLMRVILSNTAVTSLAANQPFGPLIGNSVGGQTTTNSYYLDINTGVVINGTTSLSVTNCSLSAGSYGVSILNPSPTLSATYYFTNNGGGGNSIKTFSSITSWTNSHSFSEVDQNLSVGTLINLVAPYTSPLVSIPGAAQTVATVGTLATYCSGGSWAGVAGSEKCTSGYDIVYEDRINPINNKGVDRMINYYLAKMNNAPIPANAPIWQLSSGDSYPRLMQVEN